MTEKRTTCVFFFPTLLCIENPQIQVVIFCCLNSLSKVQRNKMNYMLKETFVHRPHQCGTERRLKTSGQNKNSQVIHDFIYSSGNPASLNFFLGNFVRFLEVSYPMLQEASCLHDYSMYFNTFSFFFCSLNIQLLLPLSPRQISTVLPIPTGNTAASPAVTD